MVKKICFFINKISLAGGAERVVCNLASDFARRGIETIIITQQSDNVGYKIDENVKVVATSVSCKIPGVRLIARSLKLRRLLNEIKPDVVISFMTMYNIILAISTLGLSIKICGSERIYPKTVKGLKSFLSKILYPRFNGFVFQTNQARACFKGKFAEKATVIFNPLIDNIPRRKAAVNKIVAVGRLTDQKNYPLLINAFNKFYELNRDYELHIYGKGEKMSDLKYLVGGLDCAEAVHFMGATQNVLEEISDAKMFALTSDFEGMPNALAEAMAIGIPCIATDSLGGGAAALIEEGKNGFLISCGDEKALVDRMILLANNAELADAMGQAAMCIRNELGMKNISNQWLCYIESIIK